MNRRGAEAQREDDPRTRAIIGAAIEVHRALGPGLMESAYEECLCHELNLRGLHFERQVRVPVDYKGVHLDCGYRVDLIVAGEVVVDLKTVETLLPIHDAQLLTYLKLLRCPIGLLINYHVEVLRHGVRRMILSEVASPPDLCASAPLRSIP